jgi:primosomal protein N' (replication factor Y)
VEDAATDGARRPSSGAAPSPTAAAEGVALLDAVRAAGARGIRVDDLPSTGSRASRLRWLRDLEANGELELAWRVRPAGGGPREERWARMTEAGARAVALIESGERLPGWRLGPRQTALLAELASRPGSPEEAGAPAARLAERYGASAVSGLARRGFLALATRRVERRPLAGRPEPRRGALPPDAGLTPQQTAALTEIEADLEGRIHRTYLLDGDSASGKTAVYGALIARARSLGRGALVLVPEVALSTPIIDRLRHDLGEDVAVLHSGLGEGERADEWRRIAGGHVGVVVGTRIAALTPPPEPGVVIVDEEHDPAYKSDRTPRYQARDVAVELGRLAGAPVVLGSATPDVVTIGQARLGLVRRLELRGRASGSAVPVSVVDLRRELAEGNRGLLSGPLISALASLDRAVGERAILLINRRGSASIVLCRDCGYVQVCPECLRPLVYHASAVALRCHHCGASAPLARSCPACDSPRIRYLGGGTERVEREVRVRLPELRVGRLDRDVVERRGEAARVIDAFEAGSIDVLVGTSMVAKGLDVPEVTLVGVVSADIALNLPDERATERTWQLLAQAVGRAGRGDRAGRAIIQTYQPDHPVIDAVASGDASRFIDAELERRRAFGSPPFGRIIKLTAAHVDRAAAETEARRLAAQLRDRARGTEAGIAVLGPVPAYVPRRAGRWRYHVVLRGRDPAALLGGDPGAPWSIDVDPESLL